MTSARRWRIAASWLALVIALIGSAGCSTRTDSSAAADDRTPSPSHPSLAERHTLGPHDVRLVARLARDVRKWNKTAGLVVRAYRDPSVPANLFVIEGHAMHLPLTRIADDMLRTASAIEGPLGGYMTPALQVYVEKIIDVGVLVKAVEDSNGVAEHTAQRLLFRDGQLQGRLLRRALAKIRAYYGNDLADHLAGIS